MSRLAGLTTIDGSGRKTVWWSSEPQNTQLSLGAFWPRRREDADERVSSQEAAEPSVIILHDHAQQEVKQNRFLSAREVPTTNNKMFPKSKSYRDFC